MRRFVVEVYTKEDDDIQETTVNVFADNGNEMVGSISDIEDYIIEELGEE